MSEDFIKIKQLEGELKWYHNNNGLGVTVSTKELVVQKPHLNYHIKLEDIVSIVPYEPKGKSSVSLINEKKERHEVTRLSSRSSQQYKLDVERAVVHNRSGELQMGRTVFILPIYSKLLQAIAGFDNMKML